MMAYNTGQYDSRNKQSNFNSNYKQQKNNERNDYKIDATKMDLKPMELPDNYLQIAEDNMKEIAKEITTSKIRGFLSLVSKVYNVENVRTEETLLPESIDTIQMMRIRIVYEAGRDNTGGVTKFLDKTRILNYIKSIGDNRSKFIAFARYMEALVAYHRFYGGKE